MKNKSIFNVIFIVLLAAIIVFFSLSYIFLPSISFSENENRVLADIPTFTFEKLLDGTYTRQLHNYFSDQINFRSLMISTKAYIELALGKHENNGVLFGKDGYLIETHQYTDENYSFLSRNLKKIENLINKIDGEEMTVVSALIPRKVDVLQNKLPPYYSTERNKLIWNEVGDTHINLTQALIKAQRTDEVFYKTDHHWTSFGAYTAYRELAFLLGYSPAYHSSFDMIELSTEFYGTSYSKSGYFLSGADVITTPSVDKTKCQTTIVDIDLTFDGLYDESYLAKKDKYSVFLSGNNAHVKIIDTQNPDKETLLIIKDSYSHSLVPYLVDKYNIELIDPRYYTGSIEEYINESGIKNVLFLFGIDTLASANISIR